MWVCSKCGSSNVETLVFVKINDIKKIDFESIDFDENDANSSWCNDCLDNTTLEQKEGGENGQQTNG